MAEAFAALSIAANIAQFVVYAKQLISGGKEIYSSLDGAQNEHEALKAMIEDIRHISDDADLLPPPTLASPDEKRLLILAAQCEPVADELMGILKDLEVPHDARFRGLQSVRQTIRSSMKKKTIQDLQRRLEDIDGHLRYRTLRMLQGKHYSNVMSAINTLTQKNVRLKVNTDLKLEKLRSDIVMILTKQGNASATGHTGLDSLSEKLLTLAAEGKKVEAEQKILESLIFEEMYQREETIKDAHKSTLDWMFNKNDLQFMDWLEAEKGIYWVRGKAGSGKSTLMKYICNHSTTRHTLRSWAGSKRLFTANFFFWNAGFPMQKSQVGLLQSLLYQVLRACPELIAKVCQPREAKEPWKRKDLFEALDEVSKQESLPAKFCFFVDGLDEYEGDNEDIIALLRDLASSPSVKICVSSRPWNDFLDAFEDSQWKLTLEDLTKSDMQMYVATTLVENAIFARMAMVDPRCGLLVRQIADKAQGVWLWVWLVVRDLLRDLRGEEEFPLLQRRLDSFPDELEGYFSNIMGRIDKIHREETAKIFLVAVEAVQPIPLLSLKYLNAEAEDRDYALKLEMAPLSIQEVFRTKLKWRKLLNSRCRDLLEVTGIIEENEHFLGNRVDFLHRTVRDFLRDNYQDELRRRAGTQFDAKYSLSNIIVALVKVSVLATSDSIVDNIRHLGMELLDLVDEMLHYARDLERERGQPITTLLDELDRSVGVQFKQCTGSDFHWSNATEWSLNKGPVYEELESCTFLALTIEAGLRLYVKEKLDCNKSVISGKRGRPLLEHALRPTTESLLHSRLSRLTRMERVKREDTIDPQIVRILLERGSDPNQRIRIYNETVWSLFLVDWLKDVCNRGIPRDMHNHTEYQRNILRSNNAAYEAIELMIDHGADPKVGAQKRIWEMFAVSGLAQSTGEETTSKNFPLWNFFEAIFGHDKTVHLRTRMDAAAQRNQSQATGLWKILGWR